MYYDVPVYILQPQMQIHAGSMRMLVYKLVMLFSPCTIGAEPDTLHCANIQVLPQNLQAGWPS